MRKFLRGLALLVLGLVVLFGGFAAYIALKPLPSYPETPLRTVNVPTDSMTLALGQKLVVMNCTGCHMNEAGTSLSGTLHPDLDSRPLGLIYSANITQHPTNGIGAYTDAELYRLLRTGIKRDGSLSVPMMGGFPLASETDTEAMIAFLRMDHPLVQADATDHPEYEPTFLAKMLYTLAWKPTPYPSEAVVMPSPDRNSVDYGKYLVQGRYLCYECHSGDLAKVNRLTPEMSPGYLEGGYAFHVDYHGEQYEIMSPSLVDGFIRKYDEAAFIATVMWGQHPEGRGLKKPMHPYTMMDSTEAKAIYTYLLNYQATPLATLTE